MSRLAVGDQVIAAVQKEFTQGADEIVDVPGAARVTSLSVKTIYALTRTNQIPHSKPPGRKKIYFSTRQLRSWMMSGRR
jgi:predicted DNA-binding transcriptional regulator AlpA